MKKIALIVFLFSSLYAQGILDKSFPTLGSAIKAFKSVAVTYQTNIYLFQDEKKIFHVQYNPDFTMETKNSFLQIYSSKFLNFTLEHYKRIKNKKYLYIKKFNSLYFLRLSNQSPEYTRDMFMKLQKNFPDIYYSSTAKKSVQKTLKMDNKKHNIVFLKDRKTNILKDILLSVAPKENLPSLKMKKIYRNGNLDRIYDLRDYISNFAIVRGDVLGIINAGLYGFEAYKNYGILCSHSKEILYLVSTKKIKSIYDLRRKKISIGNISDISQIYLKDIAKASGVILNIDFKSFNFKDSIKKVRNGVIDAFFIFAPKKKVLEIVKNGLYVSSMPNDFLKILNDKQGLNSVKYKIDGRLIRSYSVPDYIVGVVKTLDTNLAKKVRKVVESFGCYKQAAIPNPFYGKLHPELMNAITAIKADADAAAKEKKLFADKSRELSIKFYKEKKIKNKKIYYYQIKNVSPNDINLTFQTATTNALDKYAVKPHHLFKIELAKTIINVKANSTKLISFRYFNPFAIRINNLKLELKFKKTDSSGEEFSIPLTVGDE